MDWLKGGLSRSRMKAKQAEGITSLSDASSVISASKRSKSISYNLMLAKVKSLMSRLAKRKVHRIDDIVCNIYLLPVEITAHIFTLLLPRRTITSVPIPTTTPLLLGAVCSVWRNIIWSLPHFWTDIPVCISVSKARSKVQCRLLEEWISRTDEHLLSFVIRADSGMTLNMWFHGPAYGMIHLICQQSRRWRTIDLDLPFWVHSSLSDILHDLPHLEVLSLCSTAAGGFLDFLTNFKSSRKLRNLHLCGTGIFGDLLPYAGLEYFRLSFCRDYECWELLLPEYKVTHLRFENIISSQGDRGDNFVILSSVQTVEMILDSPEVTNSLLNHFLWPGLKSLTINLSCLIYDFLFQSISLFCLRSHCCLEHLTLSIICISSFEEQLIQMLESLPHLISLHLIVVPQRGAGSLEYWGKNNGQDFCGLSKILFQSLCSTEQEFVLPNLEILIYEGPLSLNAATLDNLLTDRRSPSYPESQSTDIEIKRTAQLQTVSIKTNDSIENLDGYLTQFKLLRNQGLDLSLVLDGIERC
ncbi:hypothetical protein BDQ12DRAFT_258377 [Crucibulum laeve]|uniref:F-box domain-containing protein n=1 Tax=Crucibulum laeve TaxID=68775 RepID=A0A5C3M4Q2_9AGAR|nr:hypothetical protein BDQ12DRAFT_258377 [Crucibulum laeve]